MHDKIDILAAAGGLAFASWVDLHAPLYAWRPRRDPGNEIFRNFFGKPSREEALCVEAEVVGTCAMD